MINYEHTLANFSMNNSTTIIIFIGAIVLIVICVYLINQRKKKEAQIALDIDQMVAKHDIKGLKKIYTKHLILWSTLSLIVIGLLVYNIVAGYDRIIHYLVILGFFLYRTYIPAKEVYQLRQLEKEDQEEANREVVEESGELRESFELPEASYVTLQVHDKEEDSDMMVLLNNSLMDFEHKAFFDWECVVNIEYEQDENGFPTEESHTKLNNFFEELDDMLCSPEDHPNALFFVRLIGDGIAECVWMVNNPDPVDEQLSNLIESGNYPLLFEYRMERDINWENYSFFLDPDLLTDSDEGNGIENGLKDTRNGNIYHADNSQDLVNQILEDEQ